MSTTKETKLFGIVTCIESRLWYTSLIIYQTKQTDRFASQKSINDSTDLIQLELLTRLKNEERDWISRVLLKRLVDDVDSSLHLIPKQRRDYAQTVDVFQLRDDVPTYMQLELGLLLETILEHASAKALNKTKGKDLSFLKENLCKNPAFASWIVNQLLFMCSDKRDALEDFCTLVVKELLERVHLPDDWVDDSSDESKKCNSSEGSSTFGNDRLGAALCVLSKLKIPESKVETWLFPALSKTQKNARDLELALYSREDRRVFNRWSAFVDEACRSLQTLDDTPCIYGNELLKQTVLTKSHWFTNLLDTCCTLIAKGKHDSVSSIFSYDLFKNIPPLLLFKIVLSDGTRRGETNVGKIWKDRISLCNSVKFLLNKCDLPPNSYFESFRKLFVKYTKIMERLTSCKRSKTLLTKDTSEIEEKIMPATNVSAKDIFLLLQQSNTLSVLKLVTRLHDIDYGDVEKLLNDVGEPGNTFQAYSSVLKGLKAILLCNSYNANQKLIAGHFAEMNRNLQALYPLDVRLKVMENIFSLLFSQQQDFSVSQTDFDEDSVSLDDKSQLPLEQGNLQGFLCNKYAVRDTLHHLKEIISVAEKQHGISASKTNDDAIRQSISSIGAAIADATWRLELFTSPRFVKSANRPDDRVQNASEAAGKSAGTSGHSKGSCFFYKDDSAPDERTMRSDSSSESGLTRNAKSRRRSRIAGTRDGGRKPFFVNLMLAPNESLAIQCLWKNEHAKAEEVLEACNMKNSQLYSEVRFSKALHTFKDDAYKNISTLKDQNNKSSDNTQAFSTLENIRLAAQEGMQSSRSSSQLETFLASQRANLQTINRNVSNENETVALCALDLALTVGQVQNETNLCDVAMKYLKLCEIPDYSEYARFFTQIHQLLRKLRLPVTSVLCNAEVPLSVNAYKKENDCWTNVKMTRENFRESQSTDKDATDEIVKNNQQLVGCLRQLEETIVLCGGNKKYLPNVYSHFQLLCEIAPVDDSIITVSDLLKVPLHHFFGHQIFDLNVEPNKLERIAQSLRVNLVYSIVASSCPKVPCEEDVKCDINGGNRGFIVVLNKNEGELDAEREAPNPCVAKILTDLLEVLDNFSLGQSNLSYQNWQAISKRSEVQIVLERTSRLASLNLAELTTADEIFTFFLNTWNLMFLHASLTIWAYRQPFNNLERIISLMSIGYVIGDLGLVTLASLRRKLLKSNYIRSEDPFFLFDEVNEPIWKELDIVDEPRVIFAMTNEFVESPSVRVFSATLLNEDLNNAFSEYLDYYGQQERYEKSQQNAQTEKTILLPEFVGQYDNVILKNSNSQNNLLSVEDYFKVRRNINAKIQYATGSRYSDGITLNYSNCTANNEPLEEETSNLEKIILKKPCIIRSSLSQYLEGNCWVLSYLLQRIHNESPTILKNNCDNLKRTAAACLENLLSSPWVGKLTPLFEDNQTLAGIHEKISIRKLWSYFEEALNRAEWRSSLELLNSLEHKIFIANPELQYFKDKILSCVVSQDEILNDSAELLEYIYQIKNVQILTQTVLQNVDKWDIKVCESALLHAMHHVENYKLPNHCKLRIEETLCRIAIFHKMLPYCANKPNETWYDLAYCTEKIDPYEIIKGLMDQGKFELCLEWLERQAFSFEIDSSVTQDLLIGLLKDESENFDPALKLLQALPVNESVEMGKRLLKQFNTIGALQFITNFLLERCKVAESVKYRRTLLGLDILRLLEVKERSLYIHLINEPLLMLEQLLMNSKFESVQKILSAIKGKLGQVDISIEKFDEIIRFYAERSLDFRVSVTQRNDGIENKSRNVQHSEVENVEFVMPATVPTKEEWIPNEKARECSCCKSVIFSMFNRRHHCRRCGRVICAVCSQHRMQVPGYPLSVAVRVCVDCKEQTMSEMRAVQGTPSSETFDYWRLTIDETHNQTVREEFSFEYAPNVSMCLAILNLHSDHKKYTSFLLDRCDEMKRLLQPVTGGKVNPEVDHTVIIKMIWSLLVAAKVKCAKLGLNTGLAHCDRFLSQVDLIATLVQSDCIDLIPSDSLGEHTLRKMRDLLIEKEEWTLALDVSTKAGLDRQGVWATWGKACLKMGYFDQARDKFFHCLDKIFYEDIDDWVILSYGKESSPAKKETQIQPDGRRSQFVKNRPQKDPPLLTEILQILSNLSTQRQHPQRSKLNTAQEILSIAVKRSSTSSDEGGVHYEESLYYLLRYGSYNSIIEFFLKHEQLEKCLSFVLENDLEADWFFSAVYVYCLKNGSTEALHESMKSRDSSLLVWKKYLICVCRNLERRGYFNVLYQLQLFMKDCIRAAMTCIRFYVNEANDYTDLYSREKFLLDAQKHLETELESGTVTRKRRKSTASGAAQGILTMEMEPLEIDKHVNTISRQMEIVKFLATCETEGRSPVLFLRLFPDVDCDSLQSVELPTLFGTLQQKIHLAVLAILCGRDIEEGFGIAFRIMQDYNLPQQKVYSLAGHVLAMKNNISGIEQLVKCCHTSGIPNSHVVADYVLTHCIKLLLNHFCEQSELVSKHEIDTLVRLITDVELKINAYIECKQLKAAYLLAVKHSRVQDVKKILKEADRLGQHAIKSICVKWLGQNPTRNS